MVRSKNKAALTCLLCAGFCLAHVAAEAGWDDPDILLQDGHWVRYSDGLDPNAPKPHPPLDDAWKRSNATIIVLIAALRETRCPETLHSMFENAKYSDRVHVGLVQQNDDSDVDCVAAFCKLIGKPLVAKDGVPGSYDNPNKCEQFPRVNVLRMKASEAAGPVVARAHQLELIGDQEFCMQIDAHTLFVKDWDVKIANQWGSTQNEFAVLSTYPTNYKDMHKNSNNHNEMPHMCGAAIMGNGVVSNNQASAAANLRTPLLSPLWAAGLSFSRCHAEKIVPQDPHLRHIFSGEEFSRGARLWTAGYDFYTITRPVIGTYYGGEKGGLGGWNTDGQELQQAEKRMATLLRVPGSDQSPEAKAAMKGFDLGTSRTLEQYAELSGVDTMKMHSEKKCVVRYVPWSTPPEILKHLKKRAKASKPKQKKAASAKARARKAKAKAARAKASAARAAATVAKHKAKAARAAAQAARAAHKAKADLPKVEKAAAAQEGAGYVAAGGGGPPAVAVTATARSWRTGEVALALAFFCAVTGGHKRVLRRLSSFFSVHR